MSNENRCPICESEVKKEEDNHGGNSFKCVKCGSVEIEQQVYEKLNKNLKLKSCLYFYFTHMAKKNVKYFITNNESFKSETQKALYTDEIVNIYPDNISERIDKILLNFSNIAGYIGDEFYITDEDNERILFINLKEKDKKNKERDKIIKIMEELEYIKVIGEYGWQDKGIRIDIRFKGWQRIDKISKKYKSNKKAFIAMSFDDKLKPIRGKIKEAIIEMGYIHSIIDEKDHNEFIVSEIMYEIETSDFVVADLTGNRGGVYFEAGYARALGKEVIFTVDKRLLKDEDSKEYKKHNPHFDVQQINQVRYENEKDLQKQLMKRIEATVGKAN